MAVDKGQQISPLVAAIVIILVLLIVVGLGFYFSQRRMVPETNVTAPSAPGQPGTPRPGGMPLPPNAAPPGR